MTRPVDKSTVAQLEAAAAMQRGVVPYREGNEVAALRAEVERLRGELARVRGDEMRVFDQTAPCPKCGMSVEGLDTYGCRVDAISIAFRPARRIPFFSAPCRIERHCRRCGAVWYERPRDAAGGGA